MVGGSTGVVGFHLEPQPRQIQIIDENIDHPNRAVFHNIVIKALGKQGGLVAILAFNESASFNEIDWERFRQYPLVLLPPANKSLSSGFPKRNDSITRHSEARL